MASAVAISWILFGGLAFFIVIRVPLGFSLGIAGLLAYVYGGNDLVTMAQSYYDGLDSFPMLAVPMFVLAGELMEKGGMSKRLIEVAERMIGSVRGGLGMISVLACMFFAAISGSGIATTAAVGGITVPAMIKSGYPRPFAGAIVAAGGTLGPMIPPSLLLIMYGVITGESISCLFLAGVLPGILVGLGMMLTVYIICRIKKITTVEQKFSFIQLIFAFKRSFLSILAPVLILAGIYGGFFTPTESGVVAVMYAFLICTFVYKELTWPDIWQCIKSTAIFSGRMGIIWAVSAAYGEVMTVYRIPAMLSQVLTTITSNPYLILILICIFLTFLGCIMNAMSQIIILTPIFYPICQALGIDPVQFAIIFVINAEIGFITPPLGATLFVGMDQAKCTLGEISIAVLPFILSLFIWMGFLIFFPSISLLLPRLFLGYPG